MTGLIVSLAIVGIGLTIAASRQGSDVLGLRTRRLLSFAPAISEVDAMKAIIAFAHRSGYTIAAIDENKGQLVLEQAASDFSWGFYFPVSLTHQADGSTLVEVGIKSKLYQAGFIVSRSHSKCVSSMKAALGLAA